MFSQDGWYVSRIAREATRMEPYSYGKNMIEFSI